MCLLQIKEMVESEDTATFEENLALLYGIETLQHAHKLLSRKEQYFGLETLGTNMEGSLMHKSLLEAYAKVWR